MQPFSFLDFQQVAYQAQRVAICDVFPANAMQSSRLYALLHNYLGTEGVIFEDLSPENQHRYSYLCFNPISTLEITSHNTENAIEKIRQWITLHRTATRSGIADKITNLFGLFSYDVIRCLENLPDSHAQAHNQPLVLLHAYELSITLDHATKRIFLSIVVPIDDQASLLTSFQHAQQRLQALKDHILTQATNAATIHSDSDTTIRNSLSEPIEIDISDELFMEKILQAKQLIKQGELFQIVLSRCFKVPYSANPLTLYQHLCESSPTHYMIYFPTSHGTFVAASPERLIQVHNRQIVVNPIAGTRPRTGNQSLQAIENDLLNDPKERAEHCMLVDLARNDVGRVSIPGSVEVKSFMDVKHYSHTSHINSTVTGTLSAQVDVLDAFFAAFPAGTLTGAPKIRAMQCLDTLESSRREWYGGAFCRFDAHLNLDSAIAIRTAHLHQGVATIRSGAGVVQDSDPRSETDETRHKAKALLDAIAKAMTSA